MLGVFVRSGRASTFTQVARVAELCHDCCGIGVGDKEKKKSE